MAREPLPPRIPASGLEPLPGGVLDADLLAADGLADALLEQVSLANVRALHVSLHRVVLRGCRMTGLQLAESTFRDMTIDDCRIDLAAFRVSRFERVVFRNCMLQEADFVEARLDSVVFEDCDLSGADLSHATFSRSQLRGCRLDGIVGAERLRGTAMPWPDIVGFAGELAAAIGIAVLEDEPDS
ncbi:MAG: pentapeptide repeat protein [Conexibacter sp.]|nr:pentapeptide repeat protein [Conexibacter sp.]